MELVDDCSGCGDRFIDVEGQDVKETQKGTHEDKNIWHIKICSLIICDVKESLICSEEKRDNVVRVH